MRYVSAIPHKEAEGLTREVYEMIREDFFRNGSLTSRSKVPELLAAIWTAGRESMLVADRVDRTTKDAISAVLSRINDCPYCEDMLISLVHAGGDHEAAGEIFAGSRFEGSADLLRRRLEWVTALATECRGEIPPTPFTADQLPEVIGTLMGMSDINRYSHVVMSDSPVSAPMGIEAIKAGALRLFGSELKVTRRRPLQPGRALPLLPPAELPSDMQWASANPRVADAVARYAAAVEREGASAISPTARAAIVEALDRWEGETMPLDGRWIDEDLGSLTGEDRAIARLAVVVGKASYRTTEDMVTEVLEYGDEARFVRILAWSTFAAARRFAGIVADRIGGTTPAVRSIAA
jgi:AhpD family alkylhydroperoxidase